MAPNSLLPESLLIADLEAACRRETQLYRNGQSSNSHYCLEIFNRALRSVSTAGGAAKGDHGAVAVYEEACAALVRIYSPYVRSQLVRFATPATALEDLEQQVSLRFWQAAHKGLTFISLPGALQYLMRTAASVRIAAQQQVWKQQREQFFTQADTAGAQVLLDQGADPFDQYVQQRVRARVSELLTDPIEYKIFRMRYDLGFPPREIARHLANEGVGLKNRPPTARTVSDLLELCYRRLRQDPELRDLLGGD
jgi:DNA-directed RNA polymerase specialized sigma24 family protein